MNRIKTIRDLDVTGKRALVRVDLSVNIPVDKRRELTSDRHIRAVLPTIRNLLNRGAAVILISEVECSSTEATEVDHLRSHLVANHLQRLLLGTHITRCDDAAGSRLEQLAERLKPGQVLLVENAVFHSSKKSDYENFASRLCQLGDFYVNDAFAVDPWRLRSHYEMQHHFSEYNQAIGLLVEKELLAIDRILDSPKRPFVAVLGGFKVSDKLGLIKTLQEKADRLLIGGAIAYTFLKTRGISVGESLIEEDQLHAVEHLLDHVVNRFVLPTDHIVTNSPYSPAAVARTEGDIEDGWRGMDLGPFTTESFCKSIEQAGTVIWNGPLGKFEEEPFRKGTEAIAHAIAESPAISLIGGGETVAAVEQLGLSERMTHVSTGGGAFLEYLETGTLPSLSVVQRQEHANRTTGRKGHETDDIANLKSLTCAHKKADCS